MIIRPRIDLIVNGVNMQAGGTYRVDEPFDLLVHCDVLAPSEAVPVNPELPPTPGLPEPMKLNFPPKDEGPELGPEPETKTDGDHHLDPASAVTTILP